MRSKKRRSTRYARTRAGHWSVRLRSAVARARRRVRIDDDFRRDHAAQVVWLVEHGRERWAANLQGDTEDLVARLRVFPEIGLVRAVGPGAVLRMIRYVRTPHVAWYAYDPDDVNGDLWLVRLFHADQLRPAPDLGRWLATAGPLRKRTREAR